MSPDQVLEQLKAAASNRRKVQSLEIVDAVCREQHERGSTDFSIAQIGRLSAERGGPAIQTIRNKTGDDFKALISAWATHTGGSKRRAPKSSDRPVFAVLDKIPDPAVRAVVGAILAQNTKLIGEVNLLKRNTKIVIDRRRSNPAPTEPTVQVVPALRNLTATEKAALRHALSEDFMKTEGWIADQSGRVLNAKGRVIFKAGFATAMKKVLAQMENQDIDHSAARE